MTNDTARGLIVELHKNRYFRPEEADRKFLEDLSFYLSIDSIKISEKQSKRLKKIADQAKEEL